MRITRETLLKIARETAERQGRRDRGLVCIYLTGSLLTETPLLGGSTDIDLVYVHSAQPIIPREIIQINDEVHLDIAHYSISDFQPARKLRHEPWLGSYLTYNPIVLHDMQHWFEFTQASAGAQFDQPENTILRARKFSESARQGWMDLQTSQVPGISQQIMRYLKVMEQAANAIAVLSGPPLTERRFLLEYPRCAAAINRPGLAAGLGDLISGDEINQEKSTALLPSWQAAFLAACAASTEEPKIHPARLHYYGKAIETLSADQPSAAAWLLLRTWTRSIAILGDSPDHQNAWLQACQLFMLDMEHFEERLNGLDGYLDTVEETLDEYSQKHGV